MIPKILITHCAILLVAALAISLVACKEEPPVKADNSFIQDTTSHNIVWSLDSIGYGNTFLTDVAIINKNLVYVTGQIFLKDSTGKVDEYNPYNLAIWNGLQWEYKKIQFRTDCNNAHTFPYQSKAIWAFDSANIWICGLSQIAKYNGSYQTSLSCIPVSVLKIWGLSKSDIWVSGEVGGVAHYDGTTWQNYTTPTTVRLTDIYGTPNGSIIWAAGFESSYGSILLKNSGSGFFEVTKVTQSGIPHPPDRISYIFTSIWTNIEDTIYLGSTGRVYAAPKYTDGSFAPARENIWWDYAHESEYPPLTNFIRGTSNVDIFVGGYMRSLRHWNGSSWYRYSSIEGAGSWKSFSIKDDFVVAVGSNYVARGYRK